MPGKRLEKHRNKIKLLVFDVLKNVAWNHGDQKVAAKHKKGEPTGIFPDKENAVTVHKIFL